MAMAIEIPHEAAMFLNFCGVPYPDINEDDVRALATYVRDFAENVSATHQSTTAVIKDMNTVYSGYSYEALLAAWFAMSATHMAELDRACKVVSMALDVAAEVITAVKVVVLAELAALAASFMVALATPGMLTTTPLFAAAARRICHEMTQSLIGYVIAEVFNKAIEPLEQTIERLIQGAAYNAAEDLLGVPQLPNASSTIRLHIEPEEVRRYANILDKHAEEVLEHAASFAEDVALLNFSTTGNRQLENGPGEPYARALTALTNFPLISPNPEILSIAKNAPEIPSGNSTFRSQDNKQLDTRHVGEHITDRNKLHIEGNPPANYDSSQLDSEPNKHSINPIADELTPATSHFTLDGEAIPYHTAAEQTSVQARDVPTSATIEQGTSDNAEPAGLHSVATDHSESDAPLLTPEIRSVAAPVLACDPGVTGYTQGSGANTQQSAAQDISSKPPMPWMPTGQRTPTKPLPSKSSAARTPQPAIADNGENRGPIPTPWSRTRRIPDIAAKGPAPKVTVSPIRQRGNGRPAHASESAEGEVRTSAPETRPARTPAIRPNVSARPTGSDPEVDTDHRRAAPEPE
jgi:hypothetical protein